MPSGWPSAIAPPFGLTCSASSGRPSCAQRGQAPGWRKPRSARRHRARRSTSRSARRSFLRGRRRADAHDARRHAGGRTGDDARDRRQAMPGGRRLGRHDQGGGAVIDARRVAGGDRPALAKRRRQPRELLDASFRAADARRARPRPARPCAARCVTGVISLAKRPLRDRCRGARLRASGEGVLVLAADRETPRRRSRRSRASNRCRSAPSSGG